jgi:hypothetical protein
VAIRAVGCCGWTRALAGSTGEGYSLVLAGSAESSRGHVRAVTRQQTQSTSAVARLNVGTVPCPALPCPARRNHERAREWSVRTAPSRAVGHRGWTRWLLRSVEPTDPGPGAGLLGLESGSSACSDSVANAVGPRDRPAQRRHGAPCSPVLLLLLLLLLLRRRHGAPLAPLLPCSLAPLLPCSLAPLLPCSLAPSRRSALLFSGAGAAHECGCAVMGVQ